MLLALVLEEHNTSLLQFERQMKSNFPSGIFVLILEAIVIFSLHEGDSKGSPG